MLIPTHIEHRAMEAVRKEFFPEGIPEDFQEAFQKAFQKGFQEGYQQGLKEGFQIARREIVLEVLNDRFNPVPPSVIDRINQISDLATLKQLCKRVISIGSLAEFEEVL
jgi:flagellar biosynthesis/type III secretory pathway protein FliH